MAFTPISFVTYGTLSRKIGYVAYTGLPGFDLRGGEGVLDD